MKNFDSLKPLLIVFGVIIFVLLGVFVSQKQKPITSQPPENISSETFQPPADWKTYQNNMFGFEVKYPPNYKVRINDPYGTKNPAFIDEKYEGTLEEPALTIDFAPFGVETPDPHKASSFKVEDTDPDKGTLWILLTDTSKRLLINSEGKKLHAGCSVYSDSSAEEIFRICNQIISTLKITK